MKLIAVLSFLLSWLNYFCVNYFCEQRICVWVSLFIPPSSIKCGRELGIDRSRIKPSFYQDFAWDLDTSFIDLS
jgi:hypothetical protein